MVQLSCIQLIKGGEVKGNMTRHASILKREAYLAFYVEDREMFEKY
jgi:hypothetical protein